MKAVRDAARAATVVGTLLRHRVPGALYRDVVRTHLSNPHCPCEADAEMTARARRMRHALEHLGPAFVKLGQFLSRRPDLVPGPYLDELSGLQERTPPVAFGEARAALESVCICPSGHRERDDPESAEGHGTAHDPVPACLHCRGLEAVFDRFDPEPVATASLAQVHRAVYRGRPVAVKFLKPGVLDLLNRDLDLLSESLVTELDPEFEVLPVLTAALGPVLRRELEDRLTELRRTLPELVATYAELARRLPHLIERFLDDSGDGSRSNDRARPHSRLRDRRR